MGTGTYNKDLANSLFRSGIHVNRIRMSETTTRDHYRIPAMAPDSEQFKSTGTISPRRDATRSFEATGFSVTGGHTRSLPAFDQHKPVPDQVLLRDVDEAQRLAKEAQQRAAAEAKARVQAEDLARVAEDRARAARAELQREKMEQTRQQMRDEMAAARARAMEAQAAARAARKAAEEENVRASKAQAQASASEVARKIADAKNSHMQDEVAKAKARADAMELRAAEEAAKRAEAEGRARAALEAMAEAKGETLKLRDFADSTGLWKSKVLPKDGSGQQLLTTAYRDFFKPPYMQASGQGVHLQM